MYLSANNLFDADNNIIVAIIFKIIYCIGIYLNIIITDVNIFFYNLSFKSNGYLKYQYM